MRSVVAHIQPKPCNGDQGLTAAFHFVKRNAYRLVFLTL